MERLILSLVSLCLLFWWNPFPLPRQNQEAQSPKNLSNLPPKGERQGLPELALQALTQYRNTIYLSTESEAHDKDYILPLLTVLGLHYILLFTMLCLLLTEENWPMGLCEVVISSFY